MKARIVRYLPSGSLKSSDPVNRLFIPAKKLIVAPNMSVRRGSVNRGQVLTEFEIDIELVKQIEKVIEEQEQLELLLRRRRHAKTLDMLSL